MLKKKKKTTGSRAFHERVNKGGAHSNNEIHWVKASGLKSFSTLSVTFVELE